MRWNRIKLEPSKVERDTTSVFKLRFIIIRLCFILFMLKKKNKQFDDILNICIFLRYSKIFQLEPFHGIHGNWFDFSWNRTSMLFIKFPYGLFLDLKHSPIKIFKLKFIFGIWSCSAGQKHFFRFVWMILFEWFYLSKEVTPGYKLVYLLRHSRKEYHWVQ